MAKSSVFPQKLKFSEDFAAFRRLEVAKSSVFPQKLKFSEDFTAFCSLEPAKPSVFPQKLRISEDFTAFCSLVWFTMITNIYNCYSICHLTKETVGNIGCYLLKTA